jgi:Family of unknown function (DUF6527)
MTTEVLTEFVYEGHKAFSFHCPGCECSHFVPVEGPKAWGWCGNLINPTFTPSILVRGGVRSAQVEGDNICHSFIKAGHWHYLSDCTHKLAGQVVPMVSSEA